MLYLAGFRNPLGISIKQTGLGCGLNVAGNCDVFATCKLWCRDISLLKKTSAGSDNYNIWMVWNMNT